MGLKVFILAARRTGYESVRYLLGKGPHRILGVISQDYPNLVNDGITSSDFAALLSPSGIPFLSTDRLHETEVLEMIQGLKSDIGLSIGWRRLVREPLLSIPRLGFVNFHTSDLPRYRGFASTSWAILEGDDHIAITAHRMLEEGPDRGDILLKEIVSLEPVTDIGALFRQVERLLPGMVVRVLDGLEAGTLRPVPQEERDVLLSYPRRPSDGWVDWTLPAVRIDRLVRSVSRPYPGAFTCWNMRKVTVWKGRVLEVYPRWIGVPGHVIGSDDGRSINVLTGEGIYVIDEIQLEGEPEAVAPATLIRGVQQRLGWSPGELFEIVQTLRRDVRK